MLRRLLGFALACAAVSATVHAAELVTLHNGYSLQCDHREATGDTTRLYLDSGTESYFDVKTAEIASTESIATPTITAPTIAAQQAPPKPAAASTSISPTDLHQVLAGAGAAHDIDIDLLASVVRAESGGHPHATSRAGAEGLMQLMPGTAAQLGVHDAYAAQDNVSGGTAYLDSLLHRYHDNLALALAAYNAGPGAVDRWHGIPPYPETRAYVARIIHDFNRRYAARQAQSHAAAALAMASPAVR